MENKTKIFEADQQTLTNLKQSLTAAVFSQKLVSLLDKHVCKIFFKKSNGEFRNMVCTRNPALVKNPDARKVAASGSTKKGRTFTDTEGRIVYKTIPVFDVEANDWRSFSVDSLINLSYEKTEK